MTITGWKNKTAEDARGKNVKLKNDKALFQAGATYGVIKFKKKKGGKDDPPHWSVDGD